MIANVLLKADDQKTNIYLKATRKKQRKNGIEIYNETNFLAFPSVMIFLFKKKLLICVRKQLPHLKHVVKFELASSRKQLSIQKVKPVQWNPDNSYTKKRKVCAN